MVSTYTSKSRIPIWFVCLAVTVVILGCNAGKRYHKAEEKMTAPAPTRWVLILDATSSMRLGLSDTEASNTVECVKATAKEIVNGFAAGDSVQCYQVNANFVSSNDNVFSGQVDEDSRAWKKKREEWHQAISRIPKGWATQPGGEPCSDQGSDYLSPLAAAASDFAKCNEDKVLVIVGDLIHQKELDLFPLLVGEGLPSEGTITDPQSNDKVFEKVKVYLVRPAGGQLSSGKSIGTEEWDALESYWKAYLEARGAKNVQCKVLRQGVGKDILRDLSRLDE